MIRFLYSLYFHLTKNLVTTFYSTMICLSLLFIWFLPKRIRESVGYRIGRSWGKVMLFVSGIKVKVSHAPGLEPGKHYVFAGNHQSSFDIYLYYALIPIKFNWIAKKALFQIPFLGWAMALQGHIPVERENSRSSAVSFRKTVEKVKAGTSIAIYPEGTRSHDGKLKDFKRGAFVLARMSGMDLVPITIKNACQVAPKGRFMLNPKEQIEVTFNPPLNGKSKTLEAELRQILEKQLGEN